jgi:tetratricopeptide (TPR) repeat protein
MQPQISQMTQMSIRIVPKRLAFIAVLMFAFTASSDLHAQSLEQWTTWGDASMERGEYYGASRFYAGALNMDRGRMSLQWKQAEASRLSNQYDKAAELYQRVYGKDAGRTYPDALRWLGEMQLCDGDYNAAEETWKKVLQKEKDKNSITAQRARNAIAGCAIAREALAAPREIMVEHLPQPVNTYDSEFGACIGPDSALYFSSLRGELNKDGEVVDTTAYRTLILRSSESGSAWGQPTTLPDAINGSGDNGNVTWTLDGKHMLFTRCEKGAPCKIFIAPIDGDAVATPLPGLGEDLVSTQATIVNWEDREMLLFVSDRPGGQGGMDIWQARLENGTALEVHPLTGSVNTPGNERSPGYDPASATLWFSSDFHPGMGGYDIFTSRFENDVFQTPVHAGVPLNSPANDLYPTYYPARNEGWLTSNRIGSFAAKGETCCNDLYRFRLPLEEVPIPKEEEPIAGARTSIQVSVRRVEELRQRLPLKLYFHNDDPEPRSWSTSTDQDYATAYRRYRDLIPEYEREGDAGSLRAFFRDDVDRGYLELAELVIALQEVLDAGIPVVLDVRGHASPLAANDYNINLSMRRIESLRNHLRLASSGALRQYLDSTAQNNTTLSLNILPFGEEQAQPGISDDVRDVKRSVYAVEAARERRISVESVRLMMPEQGPSVESQKQMVGQMKQDEDRDFTFMIMNQGAGPMRLLDSKADCGCTAAELPEGDIAPGQSVPVVVHFNGRAPEGPLERTVTIRTNGTPERIELTIEGEIVP